METKSETKFTLSEADLKQAVADWITSQKGVETSPDMVEININAGSPYFSPHDAGTPASVKVSLTIKGDPKPIS